MNPPSPAPKEWAKHPIFTSDQVRELRASLKSAQIALFHNSRAPGVASYLLFSLGQCIESIEHMRKLLEWAQEELETISTEYGVGNAGSAAWVLACELAGKDVEDADRG